MNNDVTQRILHFIAHVEQVSYSEFKQIKDYLSTTEYDIHFSAVLDGIEQFYKTRHKKFPDFAWLQRQYPGYFVSYTVIPYHSDDTHTLISILRDESYRNKVLSATYEKDLEKASDLLTEYKQASESLVHAPENITEVFKDFKKERELFGEGIRTGIAEVDSVIDYLPYKGFTALVAPMKSFKTTTACNIVYDAVMSQGKNVVYFTLEDQYKSIWSNMFCLHAHRTGIDFSTAEVKKYKMAKEKDVLFQKMQTNFDQSMSGHLVVLSAENVPGFTPDILEAQLRYYERAWGSIDMVVIDHFSILDDPIPGSHLSGAALSKAYVRFLTKLSISFSEQGFVLLGLGQVTREYTEALMRGEKMRAVGVANTSEMERSCTMMLCTFANDDMKQSGTLGITVVVNRNGQSDVTCTVPIKPEFSSIGNEYIEEFDDETYNAIANGDADIPLRKNLNFGMSFTQFVNGLGQD